MKKIYALLLLITATNSQALFSQDLTFTDVIPEIREKFITYSGNTVLYYNHYSDLSNSLSTLEYLSVDASSPEGKVTKYTPKIDVDGFNQGAIKKILTNEEGFIFEVHRLNQVSGAGKILLIKREIQTLKETKRLLLDDPEVVFCKNDKEIIYLLGRSNYFQIDFDLNIVITREYDLFSNTELNIKVDTAELDDNSNILMPILVSNPEKFSLLGHTPKNRSSLYFAIFDNAGEINVISPELPATIYKRYSRFSYDAKKDELAALFITNDAPNKNEFIGQGFKYLYVRWSKTGEMVSTGEHRFNFSEFKTTELIAYSKIVKFDPDKFEFKYLDYTTPGNIEFLKNGNALYLTDILNGLPGSIFNSKLIFLVSSEGKLLWTCMLPFSNSELYRKSAYIIKDDKLHYLIFDYSDNYSNGQYGPKITGGKYNGLNSVLTERVIDLSNGEIVSNKIVTTAKSEQFTPYKFVFKDLNNLLFKYSYTQKNKEQYLKINY